RRGQAEIEAKLDLHGHTLGTALDELTAFLARQQGRGARVVLVITGKGRLGRGVLRERMLDWLSGIELAPYVSGWSPAHQRHGGEGAFYLTLRRKRGED